MGDALVPLCEVTRGKIVESVHLGAVAVVDAHGTLYAHAGLPDFVTYLRSTAKPFQAIPLVERGAADAYGFGAREIALACGSHSGSDEHAAVARGMLARCGLDEYALQCGTHMPSDRAALKQLRASGAAPTPAQHNCSGKHSGMLAGTVHAGAPPEHYLDGGYPVQTAILAAFAEMTDTPLAEVFVATDGCSAPNFAVALRSAALGFARLMDPQGQTPARAAACARIVAAMQAEPVMVSGVGELDTVLMQTFPGQLIIKRGAEGYCGLALAAGALGVGAPALGLALKVSDGDASNARARNVAVLELLRQLGLFAEAPEAVRGFARFPVKNYRETLVGEVRPAVRLEWDKRW